MNPPGKNGSLKSIAVIGAGCSGLAAAHILRDAGHTVTVFERSDTVGGRAATRRRQGFIYDHGAQYVKGGDIFKWVILSRTWSQSGPIAAA